MQFDNNSVLNIIEKLYWDTLEKYTIQCVSELGSDELEDTFDSDVDYAEMDSMDEIRVDEVEVEVAGDDVVVSGNMEVHVLVDGYVHWDRENICIGSGEVTMSYQFSFCIMKGQYQELQLEYFC